MTLGANPDPTHYADPSPDREGGGQHTPDREGGEIPSRARKEAENHTRASDHTPDREGGGQHTPDREGGDRLTKSSGQRPLPHGRGSEYAKTPANKTVIQRQIDATDRRIDELVYELYGLTEDEIRIVEEATQR